MAGIESAAFPVPFSSSQMLFRVQLITPNAGLTVSFARLSFVAEITAFRASLAGSITNSPSASLMTPILFAERHAVLLDRAPVVGETEGFQSANDCAKAVPDGFFVV